MDQKRFDGLTRHMASVRSRRAAVTALAGAVFARAAVAEPADAAIRICHFPGVACTNGRQCCSRTCSDGVCGCIKKGGDCFQVGIACCSGRCRRGKCK
jgi:hypothetical protein